VGSPADSDPAKQHRRMGKFFFCYLKGGLPLSGATLLPSFLRFGTADCWKPLDFPQWVLLKNGSPVWAALFTAIWFLIPRSSHAYTAASLQASHTSRQACEVRTIHLPTLPLATGQYESRLQKLHYWRSML